MAAASKLLQPGDYQAVVEERALEGVCGFPPCTQPARGEVLGKKWVVNSKEREVVTMEEVCRFCSRQCFRASSAWALTLQPDPAYVRPASAIAASRAAVAEATSDARSERKQCFSAAPKRVGKKADGSPLEPSSLVEQPLPKVRQKATVKFSREHHTYTVHYGEYDGGGALPERAQNQQNESLAAPPPASPPTRQSLQQLLVAPVLERKLSSAPAELDPRECNVGDHADAIATSRTNPFESMTALNRAKGAELETARDMGVHLSDDISSDIEHGDDDEDNIGFFDTDAVVPGAKWSGSPFVRAWGVLSSWLTGVAVEVLRSGLRVSSLDEESRPVHKGRRDLLMELLMARVPGEASFLSRRFLDIASILGVHQALPSVTESSLWDLLAALLLRAVLQCDVKRGVLEPNPYCEGVLNRKVSRAAQGLGISASELEQLVELLPFASAGEE